MFCVKLSRKFLKNSHFWKKKYFYTRTKIRNYFYTGALTPSPKNLSDKHLSFLESVKQPSCKVNKKFLMEASYPKLPQLLSAGGEYSLSVFARGGGEDSKVSARGGQDSKIFGH